MKFWKLQGAGNDFVAIDGRFDNIDPDDYSDLALKLCDRKFGIGSDGLLVVKNSEIADIQMVYYNADGSRGEMCGNGIRCFSKYIYEMDIIKTDLFTVETLDGIKNITLTKDDNLKVNLVKVDMGEASFNPENIPVHKIFHSKNRFIEEKIRVMDEDITVSSILIGVPHTVVFTDNVNEEIVLKYGPSIEKNATFPKKTNVNFVEVVNKNKIKVYTWERGCGYTLGCGTGMTASVIIANYLGKVSKNVEVECPGGKVFIDLEDSTYMTGDTHKIFEGTINI